MNDFVCVGLSPGELKFCNIETIKIDKNRKSHLSKYLIPTEVGL